MHWTYSRLSDFEKCPALYEGRYLARWPDFKPEPKPAADRGTRLHELMEHAAGTGARLTGALTRWNPYILALRKDWPIVRVEQEVALDKHWKPVPYKDPRMWWRGKLDVLALNLPAGRAKAVDWKSGQIYGSNADQVRLYAGVAFEYDPAIREVEVELVYLDQKKGISETIQRADWPDAKVDFSSRAHAMLSSRRFPLKPGAHCSYCEFGPRKGGPCPGGGVDRGGLQTDSTRARLVTAQAAPLRGRLPRQDFSDPAAPSAIRGVEARGRKP